MTTVLVIEDDESTREVIGTYLRQYGYDPILTDEGTNGMLEAFRCLPDLVLCDLLLPDISGYEVLQALRAAPATAHTPFIFLTARTDRAAQRTSMTMGADDYIMKPFTTDELIGAIEARLHKHHEFSHSYEQKLDTLRQNIVLALPHEMRSPLMGIIGYAELMAMDAHQLSAAQVIEMANEIVKSGWRLHHVVENTLIIAQLELTLSEPARAAAIAEEIETHPITIVQGVAERIAHAYAQPLELHYDRNLRVYSSQDNMSRVLSEIIDNAFKFSDNTHPVRVHTTLTGTHLVVTAENHGRGMSREQLHSIGAYMQFDRALYEQQGLGMGLTIARRLLELHRGHLTIESVPSQVTRVMAHFLRAD